MSSLCKDRCQHKPPTTPERKSLVRVLPGVMFLYSYNLWRAAEPGNNVTESETSRRWISMVEIGRILEEAGELLPGQAEDGRVIFKTLKGRMALLSNATWKRIQNAAPGMFDEIVEERKLAAAFKYDIQSCETEKLWTRGVIRYE